MFPLFVFCDKIEFLIIPDGINVCFQCICIIHTIIYKVKGGNLERQVIWNSQAKSSVNHKLHPLFLVCVISIKCVCVCGGGGGGVSSSKDSWAT